MDNRKIEVGQIWEVADDNFYATKDIPSLKLKRQAKFHLKKGEKIEIRYPYAWHYRAEDNFYAQSDEKYILDKCNYFGKVNEDIRFSNKASLEEILRLNLYSNEA